ncbi:hypothetical protein [Paenibacillus campi]|uniref:hypothetical protein n=1 Tax=Paenibacillus campi TaxID=3106031 RepID=UPI002B002C03|nr:hypothetical protein [Paenibacillus sp. SGZ-1014]
MYEALSRWIEKYTFMAITIVFACLFALLEFINPTFFLNGDNKVQFFPVVHYAANNLLHGVIPQIDLAQYLGLPVMDKGYYGLTYPLVYICFYMSKYVLGNEFWTMDCLTIFQLWIAMYFMYKLLRMLKVSVPVIMVGTLSYAFSSFVLFMSEWYYVSTTAMFLPMLTYLCIRAIKRPSVGLMTLIVSLFIVYIYSGNIQFIVYTFFYLSPLLIWFLYKQWKHNIMMTIGFCFVVVIGSMPMLLLLYRTGQAARPDKYNYNEYIGISSNDIIQHLLYMFWPIIKFIPISDLFYRYSSAYTIAYIGFFVCIGIVVGVFYTFFQFINYKNANLKTNMFMFYFLLAGCFALLVIWGDSTGINKLLYNIPVWNQFRSVVKHSIYVAYFLIVFGSFYLDKCVTVIKWKALKSVIVIVTIFFIFLNTISMSVITANGTHDVYKLDQTVYKNDASLPNGRVAFFSQDLLGGSHVKGADYPAYYSFNYASLLNVSAIGGYDVLIPKEPFVEIFKSNWYNNMFAPSTIDFFRNYNLRYIVVPGLLDADEIYYSLGLKQGIDYQVIQNRDTKILELNQYTPLVFSKQFTVADSTIHLDYDRNTITVDLQDIPLNDRKHIGFNVLYNTHFVIQDQQGNVIPYSKDAMQRVYVDDAQRADTLTLHYTDHMAIIAFIISNLAFIVCVVLIICWWRKEHNYA